MLEDDVAGFHLDSAGVFRPALPPSMAWLSLGFGTRRSDGWANGAVQLKQVHSSRVVLAAEPWSDDAAPEADAVISDRPGITLSVRTADCLPILLADEATRSVAAVHAGWRGTHARIAAKTVAELRQNFNADPATLWVWVGTGIGQCCFEVGPEVAACFPGFIVPGGEAGKFLLDLTAANVRQLLDAGIPRDHILCAGGCTRCDPALFHSWRRDRENAGRMIAAIGTRRKSRSPEM
ncbi:MAG TPA: peptidoglycan editing factor PgeF [Bryobacteraceae bacterium]|jgi:YfiH family protein|nr:peptidoglycan editing factor PgeF [Bryobacteraceae bacterium]